MKYSRLLMNRLNSKKFLHRMNLLHKRLLSRRLLMKQQTLN
jgi:hypothetical protein